MKIFYKSVLTMAFMLFAMVANAASFDVVNNEDGTVTITPDPATTSWAAVAYQEGGQETFLNNFGASSDAAAIKELLSYGMAGQGTGTGKFNFVNFMEMFGGAQSGNIVISIVEINEEGETVGEATTKTVAYVPVDLELEMNYAESDTYKSDVDMIFQNEEWYARFDVCEVPVVAGKTYTKDDLDLDYSYMKKKDSDKPQNWTKYEYETVKFVMQENGNMDALVTVKNAAGETLAISMYYETNDQKSINVAGEYEVIDGVVAITARNEAGDYRFLLNIKADDLKDFGMYSADNLTNVGNSIQTPWNKDAEKITDADIYAMKVGDAFKLMGTVTTANRTYNINIKVAKPEGADVVEDTIGAVLEVSEDEGDIKFKAENGKTQFIGYITCATTDVPTGSYDLLSYSKYGEYLADFGMYMSDRFQNGHVNVVNENGTITITATFEQNGKTYTVVASTPSSTGINNATVAAAKAGKFIENGKLVIVKGGKKYGVNAVEVK